MGEEDGGDAGRARRGGRGDRVSYLNQELKVNSFISNMSKLKMMVLSKIGYTLIRLQCAWLGALGFAMVFVGIGAKAGAVPHHIRDVSLLMCRVE